MKYWFLFLFLCLINIGNSQDLNFKGALFAISQTGKIKNNWNYNVFVSTTEDAFPQTVNKTYYPTADLQLYIQPSIIYTINSRINVSASYTYQRNNPFRSIYSNENRLWQQVIYAHVFGKHKLTHRLRYEERFIQNRTTNTYPLATRLRYQLGYSMPLQGKTLDIHEFYLNTYNECYFSLTGSKNATYSENWTYAGAGYNLGKYGKIELGYLLQFFVRNPQKDLRILNLAQVMWVTNF
jgi:hypothetical protein